jgi:hypothetical protein
MNDADEHWSTRWLHAQGPLSWITGWLKVYVKPGARHEGHIHFCDIWGNGRKGRHDVVNHKRVDETQPKGPPTKVFISCSEDWSDECASGVSV